MDVVPAIVTKTHNEPIRNDAERELGPEVAASIPAVEKPVPKPAEPGAIALVDSMMAKIHEREARQRENGNSDSGERVGGVTISLYQIRNQSHSSRREFNEFMQRFADLLNHAAHAEDERVKFVVDQDSQPAPTYYVQGTAYLISDEGFDMWELFLSLTPAEKSWSIWTAATPVHVLREPRPGQRQILPTN